MRLDGRIDGRFHEWWVERLREWSGVGSEKLKLGERLCERLGHLAGRVIYWVRGEVVRYVVGWEIESEVGHRLDNMLSDM